MKQTRNPSRALPLPALVGGGVTLSAALLTRWTVGSPLVVLHRLEALPILPPLWFMSLLWLASFALVGLSLGYLSACTEGNPKREALFWRGSTFLVLATVFSLLWYTLLFGKFYPLPSWLCLLFSAVAALACAASWMHIKRAPAVTVLLFALWQTYLLLLQLTVLFHT